MVSALTHYQPRTLAELTTIAQTFAASGFFKDTRDMAQAVVKMMAGAELGFGPFASMQGVHIIQGKPVLSAGLITAAIENDSRYSFIVEYLEADGCKIAFYRNGGKVGEYAFMQDDANRAGLLSKQTWKQWPKDMYFSRAISGGARKYAAGIFGGSVYTPDEFDIETNEDGEIIDLPAPPTAPLSDPLPAPHWVDNEDRREKFHQWATADMGLTEGEALEALETEESKRTGQKFDKGAFQLTDYTGTNQQAAAAIDDYIVVKTSKLTTPKNGHRATDSIEQPALFDAPEPDTTYQE